MQALEAFMRARPAPERARREARRPYKREGATSTQIDWARETCDLGRFFRLYQIARALIVKLRNHSAFWRIFAEPRSASAKILKKMQKWSFYFKEMGNLN
jgi:hypothetical protein